MTLREARLPFTASGAVGRATPMAAAAAPPARLLAPGLVRIAAAFMRTLGVVLAVALATAGCQSGYDMRDQPRYKTYASSSFFSGGTSARPLSEGVVDRSSPEALDEPFLTGSDQGRPLAAPPMPVDSALLARGRERFDIYCSPCHGLDGYADGMVVARGLTPPPSFHTDTLRVLPIGRIFQVMTTGLGRMPAYRAQIAPADRWAIAAYVRVLQFSQYAESARLPADLRRNVEGAGR